MAPASANERGAQSLGDDDDLGELYAQVWRGYVDEEEDSPAPVMAQNTNGRAGASVPRDEDELPGYQSADHRPPADFVPDSKKYIPEFPVPMFSPASASYGSASSSMRPLPVPGPSSSSMSAVMSPNVRRSRPLPAPPVGYPPSPAAESAASLSQQSPRPVYGSSVSDSNFSGHRTSDSTATITRAASTIGAGRALPSIDQTNARPLPQIDIDAQHDSGTLSGLTMLVAPQSGALGPPAHDGGVRILENRSPSPAPPTPGRDSYPLPDPYYASAHADSPTATHRSRGAQLPAIPGADQTSPASAYHSPASAYDSPASYYGGQYDNVSPTYDQQVPSEAYPAQNATYDSYNRRSQNGYDSNPSTPRANQSSLYADDRQYADERQQGLSRNTTTSSSAAPTSDGMRFSDQEDLYAREDSPPTTLDRNNSMRSFDSYYQQDLGNAMMASPMSDYPTHTPVAGPSTSRRNNDFDLMHQRKLELHDDEYEDDGYEEEEEEDEDDVDRFVNLALLSHIAVKVRDQVPRGTHVKGGIPYQRAFTGRDIVNTIQRLVQRDLMVSLGISSNQDRHIALHIARSLQSQLFFYEVEWGGRTLTDSVEDVYMFLDDEVEGMSDGAPREELPTSVVTVLTKCYSASCVDGEVCFSYACPRKAGAVLLRQQSTMSMAESSVEQRPEWEEAMDPSLLNTLPESEVKRQGIIHKVISKEEQYVQDLDTVESLFIRGLRRHQPPIMQADALQEFIEEVFGNILEVRECNRRLLEQMAVRKREQAPVVQWIGDIFLRAAADFRSTYPVYVGNLPLAEKRVKEEMESNPEFRLFTEACLRAPESRRLDLKHFITRPSEHLLKYPVLLDAILQETDQGNPDTDYLNKSIQAMRNLSSISQLRTFQSAMGRGPTGKLQWHDLVAQEVREQIPKKEAKRQAIIFEIIQTEMVYVKDLEMIVTLFVRPLRAMNPPVIPRERISQFIQDVFYNVNELYKHHRRMLDKLHEIQRDQHPNIQSISEPIFDAALNWREAYMEYIPHYPIAAYRIEDEMANNPAFKTFVDQATRHPDARRLDIKAFVNRPIPRLLRYELLLRAVLDETPPGHDDHDSIPQVLEIIKDLGKATEPGVSTAKQKVELWRYNANLSFKPGESVDMDLLDETRTLIHTGKLLRQPETGIEWNGWSELFVLLFDNYLVMTKPKERDGVTKYHVNRRPIPLDLLSLVNFVDPPQQRGTGILRGLRHGPSAGNDTNPTGDRSYENDSRLVFPCTVHHNGRLGGLYTLYAETAAARVEWLQKLQEATGLRSVVQESNKVFEIEPLSADTFLVPHITGNQAPSWSEDSQFTGKVTCSVPFSTADGRGLVAIGCAEGVWIGLRHDSRSLKRVLHLKHVTQCAMLEDFGIFLVLADKSLFAYHIEALVPSQPSNHMHTARTPQKLNGNKDVQFFSVGTLNGRTLVIYMKKKGLDSVFRVLEPVTGKIVEKQKTPGTFGRFGFGQHRSEWFRIYRQDFFLPSEAYDLIFLKARIAILCQKGFEIMDLSDFKSVTIPQRDDPRLQPLAKRCEACRPLGMFRTSENEFLLCYNEFGLYVDRHGDPSRTTGTIEWEGTAEKVAWHPPYILLFDSRFIEIRHIDTGRLVQIIPGNEIRCLWDGRGGGAPPVMTPGPDGWQDGGSQESRVHAAMRAEPMPGQHRVRGSYQHVFELVPTIPLYLPGSLSSPSADTYFPPASPPLSPRMSTSSWS